jgi:hypothetical protein
MPLARKAALLMFAVVVVVLLFLRLAAFQVRVSNSGKDDAGVTCERMDMLAIACEEYNRMTGRWPTSLGQVASVVRMHDTNIFFDSWGRAILLHDYEGTVWLSSYGADGLPGGMGTNADIVEYLQKKEKGVNP